MDNKESLIGDSNRIVWLDTAKGLGMLLTIFAHLDLACIESKWIYTFHMPLFFFLSGYVFSMKCDFKTFLAKKVRSILIPYFCLGLVIVLYLCINDYLQGFYNSETVFNYLRELVIQKRSWTLWFISCLFFLNLLFYALTKVCKNMKILAVVVFVIVCCGLRYYRMGGEPLYWNIDVCMTSIAFFFVGFLIKINYNRIAKVINSFPKSFVIFFALGIVNIIAGYAGKRIAGVGLEMHHGWYGYPPLTFLSAFAGIFCVILAAHWITIRPINYIGKNSMLYYAWHQQVAMPLSYSIISIFGVTRLDEWSHIKDIAYKMVAMVIMVIMLSICNIIITKTKLKFMVGR